MLVLTHAAWLGTVFVLVVAVGLLLAPRHAPVALPVRLARGAVLTLLAAGLAALLASRPHGVSAVLLLVVCALGGLLLVRRIDGGAGRRVQTLRHLRFAGWLLLVVAVGRPAWEVERVTWDRPPLPVLLDDSASLDLHDQGAAGPSRATELNRVLADLRPELEALAERFELRPFWVGAQIRPATDWHVAAREPLTALAAGLEAVTGLRSPRGVLPPAVLLVSDGAENVTSAARFRTQADALCELKVPLIAVGVGPEPGRAPLVELEPLATPPRVGLREVLRVRLAAVVQGCLGARLELALLWDDTVAASGAAVTSQVLDRIAAELEVVPPGPGVHRLTARVTLPAALGGHVFSTSTMVEVDGDRVRVLWLEHAPRSESAFAIRVLSADPALEITQRFQFAAARDPDAAELRWEGYDVIVLGALRAPLARAELAALQLAVAERGAGVLLAGGGVLLQGPELAAGPLADLSPVTGVNRAQREPQLRRFVPTAAGLAHPALTPPSADSAGDELPRTLPGLQRAWTALPALPSGVRLGTPKPAAEVLAADENQRALLVTQEIGRGRVALAAWEETWPWVLASDVGRALHRGLWGQLVAWLANRRPRAWVVTDQAEYAREALQGGEQRVRIQAGVSGGPDGESPVSGAPRLAVRSADNDDGFELPLVRRGRHWEAVWPAAGTRGVSDAATYTVEFSVAPTATRPADSLPLGRMRAQTQFRVLAQDLEQRPPTANLGRLREVALRTESVGGRYVPLAELGDVLRELAARDLRERVLTYERIDLAARGAWVLLVGLAVLLSLEWALRRAWGRQR